MASIFHFHHNPYDDSSLSGWRLTPLGKLAVVLIAGVLLAVMVGSLASNRQPSSSDKPAVDGSGKIANRIFTTGDAVDFTQLTYAAYIAAITNENLTPAQLDPPYNIDTVLHRLEAIRPRLSANLYRSTQAAYKRSASIGTITRDEILCGKPVATSTQASLKISGRDVAVVAINMLDRDGGAGTLEATVDLKNRVLAQISCGR